MSYFRIWTPSAFNLNSAQTLRAGVHERHHGDRPGVAGGPGPALLREDDAQVSLSHYHLLSNQLSKHYKKEG